MRIYRLAQLLEQKYLISEAGDPVREDKILSAVTTELINNFKLYVDSQSPSNRNPVLGMMVNMGEPHVARIVDKINKLISQTGNELDAHEYMKYVTEILSLILLMQGEKADVNNFILENFRTSRHADRNYRDQVMRKLWANISIIYSVYQKIARTLKVLVPDANVPSDKVEPQRGEISRDKYIDFMYGPAAQKYGLNNFGILTKVLEDPALKEKLTTLINSVDRGHVPLDGPEVAAATKEIMDLYNMKNKTNAPFFESNEPVPQATEPEEEKQ